jgi:hypothetical protein
VNRNRVMLKRGTRPEAGLRVGVPASAGRDEMRATSYGEVTP